MKKIIVVVLSIAVLFCAGCGDDSSGTSKSVSDNIQIGDTITFGEFEQDNNESNGKEPVEWIVLSKTGDSLLVITKYGLETAADNDAYDFERKDGGTGKQISWDKHLFREDMNSTRFIDYMFSEEEQNKLLYFNIKADQNPEYDENPGEDTADKIFLLSATEVDKYFGTDSETFKGSIECRKCQPTKFAEDYTYAYLKEGNTSGCWFLRTTGDCYTNASFAYVDENGVINYKGWSTDCGGCMIRPAMWIEYDF